MADQNIRVNLSFRDDATGKFTKATDEMTAAVKRAGIAIKSGTNGMVVDLDKMAKGHETAGRAARNHNRYLTDLEGTIGSLRNIMLLYFFMFRPFINFSKESINAAILQENAERKLAATLQATGRGTKENADALAVYANEMMMLTGIEDDMIVSASAMLATFKLNESQIRKAIPAVLDLTAGLKQGGDETADFTNTAKVLGRALSGQTGTLERMGVILDESTKKSGNFDAIIKAIEKSVGGLSIAMAGTFQGNAKILASAFGEFKEQLGGIVTQNPVILSAFRMFNEELQKITLSLTRARAETHEWKGAWLTAGAAIIGIIKSINFVWNGFIASLRLVEAGIESLIGQLFENLSKVIHAFSTLLNASSLPWAKDMAKDVHGLSEQLNGLSQTMYSSATQSLKDFNTKGEENLNMIDSMVDAYAKLEQGAIDLEAITVPAHKTISNSINELGKKYDALSDITNKFAVGFRDTIRDTLVDGAKTGFKNVGDIVAKFGDMLLQSIMEMIANIILLKTSLSIFGGALGYPGGVATSAFAAETGGMGHTGGYMYGKNIRYGTPRSYHSGGEVSATLLEGEGVLNRRAMNNLGVDNLDRLNRGESSGGGTVINNYYIQTIDERSFSDRLKQHGDIYANASSQGIRNNNALRSDIQRYV